MNLQFYFEKLKSSEEFQKFKKENPNAFLCSGFFAIDRQGNDNQQHFDYFVPAHESDKPASTPHPPRPSEAIINQTHSQSEGKCDGKIISFQVEKGCVRIPMEVAGEQVFEKIEENVDVNFEHVEKIVHGEMWEKGVKNEIQKYLLSLQRIKGVNYLVGTVFISGFGMIKIKINIDLMKIENFEKSSFIDMFKILKK